MANRSRNRDWNEIIQTIRDNEQDPEIIEAEIVAEPGGELVLREGKGRRELSTLPRDVMASTTATSTTDREEIRRLDPDGVEAWRWVTDGRLGGWVFEMAPLRRRFVFFAFRVPAMGNRLLLSVIEPDMDELIGHENHVMTVRLDGGTRIPVVCGSKSQLGWAGVREIRGVAAKFATYHTLRAHGRVGFSE